MVVTQARVGGSCSARVRARVLSTPSLHTGLIVTGDRAIVGPRRPGEAPADSYARVRAVPLALTVKLADMADNRDPQRLARFDAAARDRLIAKYARARAELTAGGAPVCAVRDVEVI